MCPMGSIVVMCAFVHHCCILLNITGFPSSLMAVLSLLANTGWKPGVLN